MFNRAQVKYQAKLRINQNRRYFINISFLWYLVSLAFVSFLVNAESYDISIYILGFVVKQCSWTEGFVYVQRFFMWSIVFHILVLYPFEYGFKHLFRKSIQTDVKYSDLLIGFKQGYSKVMATLLIRDMIIVIGTVFFVIPGLICNYGFRFVPYLMEDYPEKTTMELLKLSFKMTSKYKFKLFLLDCSFIGWKIASKMTGGLSDLYFTSYQGLTEASIYEIVKNSGRDLSDH